MHLHLQKVRLRRIHLCWYDFNEIIHFNCEYYINKISLINTERFSNFLDENFMTSYASLFIIGKTLFWTANKFDWTPHDIWTEKIISAPTWATYFLALIWATYFWKFQPY